MQRKLIPGMLLLLCFPVRFLSAQPLHAPATASYLRMSTYTTVQQDAFSFSVNPAAITAINKPAAAVYGERRFMLSETSLYSGALAIPSKMGHWGLNISYLGFSGFNETVAGLVYARNLGPKIAAGLRFNYYGYRVTGVNNASTINAALGALVHLTPRLHMGVCVNNPAGGKLAKSEEKLASTFNIGIGYDASDDFFVFAEAVKEEGASTNINAGMQYRFMQQFFSRAGFSTVTNAAYAGFGIAWAGFRLDICGSYHPQLGISPGLLLQIDINKGNTERTKTNSNENQK